MCENSMKVSDEEAKIWQQYVIEKGTAKADITVDGSWMKRDDTSNFGTTTTVVVDNGKEVVY